mmetsp:Transcript_40657/g.73231  ORF Transcript_40657/g.73231 Transcript_40657/m.73231 type:complete len:347 (+) Transcript_40657:58-1098(+)
MAAEPAGNGSSQQDLLAEVQACKAVLDDDSKAEDEVIAALEQLKKLGSLPTKILSETLVGKKVNTVAKSSTNEAIKAKAKELVDSWRQTHRKRKQSSENLSLPPLKRTSSVVSEAASPKGESQSPMASQASPASQEASFPNDASEAVSAAPLQRADSTLSNASAATGEGGYRDKVRQKLLEALGKTEQVQAFGGEIAEGSKGEMRDPVLLANEIEEELNKALPKKEAYMNQARSVMYNLKDSKNHSFRFKLMVGFFSPSQVPTLTAEDMASDEKNAERAKDRKYAMEALDQGWALKNGQQLTTGMFQCGKCKGTKTTYFQMQTRSSDEPMTTFVTCLTCNNRWKFC